MFQEYILLDNKMKRKEPSEELPRVGVVCANELEFDEFERVFRAAGIRFGQSEEHETKDLHVFSAKLPRCRLFVAHFGQRENIAFAGTLTSFFILKFELVALGMVGCCTGRDFNEVVCPTELWLHDFRVKSTIYDIGITKPSNTISHLFKETYYSRVYKLKDAELITGNIFSSMQSDLYRVAGIDTDSFHIAHCCALFRIQVIPIFKGVSSVWRVMTPKDEQFIKEHGEDGLMMPYAIQSASEYMLAYLLQFSIEKPKIKNVSELNVNKGN